MRQQHVLVLAYYFPPMGLSGVQRVTKFVKYLADAGWNVHVVTTGPTAYYAFDPTLLEDFEGRSITVHRTVGTDPNSRLAAKGKSLIKMPKEFLRKLASKVSNFFYVPDNKKGWVKPAIELARQVITDHPIDVMFVSGPPFSTFLAAEQLAHETGLPFVVDYRDLWYGNQFTSYPTPWHGHRNKRLEHSVLTHAGRITVTNRRMKETLIADYPQLAFDDVVIIPQGFDPDDYGYASDDRRAFRLTYTGIFYDVITPKYFFKAVRRFLKQHPDAPLELHFAGILREANGKRAKKMGLDKYIIDHGYLPHRESVALLERSSVLWMMVGNTKNAHTISSAKLYEYFGARKPILASLPQGALRHDAERYGASIVTDPTDVAAIADGIAQYYERWKAGTLPRPSPGVVEQYDRSLLAHDLAKVLSQAMLVSP